MIQKIRTQGPNGQTYEAQITVIDNHATEVVSEVVSEVGTHDHLIQIHEATFPVSQLGSACRTGYLTTMLASVIDARARAVRMGISLADALAGQVPA